MIRIVSAIRRL
jgi:hypothetical protein